MESITVDNSGKSIVDFMKASRALQRLQELAEKHPWYMTVRNILNLRPKFGIDQFLQWYYDSKVFYEDDGSSPCYWELVLKFITRSDPTLPNIDHISFKKEMKSMWLALISISLKDSLLGHDTNRMKIPEYILTEIIFTKDYLDRNGYSDFWESILFYNQAICKDIPARRARCEFLRKIVLKNIKDDYLAHIENLYITGSLESTVKNLIFASAERFGWDEIDLKSDVFLDFEVVVLTHYGDAKGLLDLVRLRL